MRPVMKREVRKTVSFLTMLNQLAPPRSKGKRLTRTSIRVVTRMQRELDKLRTSN